MPNPKSCTVAPMWPDSAATGPRSSANDTARLSPIIPGNGGSFIRPRDTRLDVRVSAPPVNERGAGSVSGGGQRPSGSWCAHGGNVRAFGGRDADGAPRFDQPVPPGGYLWWYVDALSDDGENGISLIAFVGSVFSPYYAWARGRSAGMADAENHCALNVALYGSSGSRWTMTERGRRHVNRTAQSFTIGPSKVYWNGRSLIFEIDEWGVPVPRPVCGRVTVTPKGLSAFVTDLDAEGRHRWGPIGPCSRIEVDFGQPRLAWAGDAYLDSNEGDEPVDRGFRSWDWARSAMPGGDTAVVYDVRPLIGPDRVIAQRFSPSGLASAFEAPPRSAVPRSRWHIDRTMRSDPGMKPIIERTLEDTPFYVRSVLKSGLLGELVTSVHETLDAQRVASMAVRLMLPWRMPRKL